MASATVASVSSASSSEPVSPTAGDYLLSVKSYLKIVMHALRYPHATVNGVLITEKKGKTSKQIRIVDAIPLFHSGHGLAPMTEVALTQISEYCSKSSDLVIGGYYQVNDAFHEHPHPIPTVFAERIADKIFEANPDAVLFMISNFSLATSIDDITRLDSPFFMFQNIDGKWKLKSSSASSKGFALEAESAILELTNELVFKKSHHLNIIDFDSHLENVKDDWRNPKLNEVIEQFVKSN